MPKTKAIPKKIQPNKATMPDVLTLEEAADYLRIAVPVLKCLIAGGKIPAKYIDDQWRILRGAIDDWLRSEDTRAVQMALAGSFADDETLPDILKEVYRQRGRPEREADAEH